MKNKGYIAFGIVMVFMLLPPVVQLMLPSHYFSNDYDLGAFILFQLSSLVMAFVFLYAIKGFSVKNNYYSEYKNIQVYTFFIAVLFFCVFLAFVFENVADFSQFYIFTELYRNGSFKGSGMYTLGITSVAMLMATYVVASSERLSYWFFAGLLLIMIALFMLGLRIFFLGLFLFLLIRIIADNNLFKITGILIFILAFMVSFKLYLNMNISGQSFLEVVQGVVSRINYKVLLNYSEFSMPIQEFSCLIPGYVFYSDCSLSQFKEWFVSMNPDVAIHMSYIDLYSGVALSLPILMYNLFGFFGFVFITPVIIAFILFVKKIFSTNSIYMRVLYIFFAIRVFGALVEDVGFITHVFQASLVVIATLVIVKLGLVMQFIVNIKMKSLCYN